VILFICLFFIHCSFNEVSIFLRLHFYHFVFWTSIVLYVHLSQPPFHLLSFLIYIIFKYRFHVWYDVMTFSILPFHFPNFHLSQLVPFGSIVFLD
jgi:hypothetical protein